LLVLAKYRNAHNTYVVGVCSNDAFDADMNIDGNKPESVVNLTGNRNGVLATAWACFAVGVAWLWSLVTGPVRATFCLFLACCKHSHLESVFGICELTHEFVYRKLFLSPPCTRSFSVRCVQCFQGKTHMSAGSPRRSAHSMPPWCGNLHGLRLPRASFQVRLQHR